MLETKTYMSCAVIAIFVLSLAAISFVGYSESSDASDVEIGSVITPEFAADDEVGPESLLSGDWEFKGLKTLEDLNYEFEEDVDLEGVIVYSQVRYDVTYYLCGFSVTDSEEDLTIWILTDWLNSDEAEEGQTYMMASGSDANNPLIPSTSWSVIDDLETITLEGWTVLPPADTNGGGSDQTILEKYFLKEISIFGYEIPIWMLIVSFVVILIIATVIIRIIKD